MASHGLVLLESELQEICDVVNEMQEQLGKANVMPSVCDHYFNTYVDKHGKVIIEPCEFCGEVKKIEV